MKICTVAHSCHSEFFLSRYYEIANSLLRVNYLVINEIKKISLWQEWATVVFPLMKTKFGNGVFFRMKVNVNENFSLGEQNYKTIKLF